MRVDEDLLAGLGVFQHERPEVGQLHLPRVGKLHRDHLVPMGRQCEGATPTGDAHEIRYEEEKPPAADHPQRVVQQDAEVGARRPAEPGLAPQLLDETQDVHPAALRGNHALRPTGEKERTHPVAMPGEQTRHDANEVDEQAPLLHLGGTEVHRRAHVEQEPRGHLAVLDVLAHVRGLHPGGHVPVDHADVVGELVFTQLGKLHAESAEHGAVVSLEEAVQPPDDGPVQALEDALRLRRLPRHGSGGAGQGRERPASPSGGSHPCSRRRRAPRRTG